MSLDGKKKFIVVERECWNGVPVWWKLIPQEVLDNIPGFLIYNTPTFDSKGNIEDKTVIYLGELLEDVESDMKKEYNLEYFEIPGKNAIIVIPK